MITFLAVKPATLTGFLDLVDPEFRAKVSASSYLDVWRQPTIDPATHVFMDIDRLGDGGRAAAALLWRDLAAAQGHERLLNDPAAVLRRYDLLAILHREGVNRFAAHRSDEIPATLAYPVFVRHEGMHNGSLSPLLHSRSALEVWLARLTLRSMLEGIDRRDLLVVEHLPTADADGLHRKYSAFRIGDQILPRHVLFSRGWEVKKPDLVDGDLLEEERAYIDTNPHEAWLGQIFRLANIDYGRIDYSFFQGQPQVWEINLNPTVVPSSTCPGDPRIAVHRRFARDLQEALESLDASPRRGPAAPVAVRPPPGSAPPTGRLGACREALRRITHHRRRVRLAGMVFARIPGPVATACGRLAQRIARTPG